MSKGSMIVPLKTTAKSAVMMLKTTQMTAAPKTRENVTGAAERIAGTTFSA